jgi:methyl-accepting chemotaxis protein
MAKNLRQQNIDQRLLIDRRNQIVNEALRQSESCLYTSASLFEWLKCVRWYHRIFVVAPLVLGIIAAGAAIDRLLPDWLVAAIALLASLFPALADGLKIQLSNDEISRLAAEFKNLQDRFRILARVVAPFLDTEESNNQLSELMARMDIARKSSITPPDWAFAAASKKIKQGDYNFGVDDMEVKNDIT